ncbi:MAG: hypothetical protein JKY54_13215 [Flavobacteriales bacterium]|nr:hypothetical protein [Flavobacteriales bacterium]
MHKSLSSIERKPLTAVLGALTSADEHQSSQAGLKLCSEAKSFGLNIRDYLTLAVDVRASGEEKDGKTINRFQLADGQFMTGYQATLAALNLPIKQDFSRGITLQAASDTFQSRPGSRVLFPEVIDDMLQWTTKLDQIESTQNLVAQTRTINGSALITRAVFSDEEKDRHNGAVAELANIPVQRLTDTEHAVKFFKFGSGIRTSYEFSRRVTLDVLTPYAARVERTRELDKVSAATNMLINGDAVHQAAPADKLGNHGGDFTNGRTLKDNYVALLKFLVSRAKAGTPVNTLVGNLDMYVELFLMFTPTTNGTSVAEHLQKHGGPKVRMGLDLLQGVNFEVSSAMPDGKLMCYSKEDTLEELTEAGSQIEESEQAVKNQSITYVKTVNHGYRLIYGDTRTMLDCTQ